MDEPSESITFHVECLNAECGWTGERVAATGADAIGRHDDPDVAHVPGATVHRTDPCPWCAGVDLRATPAG